MRKAFVFACCFVFTGVLPVLGAPQIQFKETSRDFGRIAGNESISGSFSFTNDGDAELKLQRPATTCSCTVATIDKDSLKPGEMGEVRFTLTFGRLKGPLQKMIMITSNDPKQPQSYLHIKVDYTPIYEVEPLSLMVDMAAGESQSDLVVKVARNDGKPLVISRIESTQPWITARIDSASKTADGTAQILVSFQGQAIPGRLNEKVVIYADGKLDAPIATVFVTGRVRGAITVAPEKLFWSITEAARTRIEASHPEPLVTRRIRVQSENGRELQVRNLQSSIQGLTVTLQPLLPGGGYEIVARLDEVPKSTVNGMITFETSDTSQPKVEVPVTLSVVRSHPAPGTPAKVPSR